MASVSDTAGGIARTPDEWGDDAERAYANRQAALAEHYGVDVESRVVETASAGPVHYLVAGDPDGEPVLLLHGVSTTAATWIPLLPALVDEYRVYVPDRPGRGLSAAPSYHGEDLRQFMVAYLLELLDAEGIDRPHVVGNSLGGQQALLLALDHDRVDRLCLVGGPGGISRDFHVLFRLMTVRGVNRLVFWLLNRGEPMESARESMAQINVVDDGAIPEEFYRVLAAHQDLPGRYESVRSLTEEQGSFGRMHSLFDLTDEMPRIERPTAFVWGSEDWFWPPDVGRPVAERMPDAEFYELDDHGHMPWMEPTDEAAATIRSFLDGEPP